MKRIDNLILAARIFDAVYQMTLLQEKDNNPDHWKTINGAHVHVDENGDYDGGAGGVFNGNHHYGKGGTQKAKEEAQKKRKEKAVKTLRSWQNPNPKTEYIPGESFEDWKRRDDIDYDNDESKNEKREILIELSENWKKLYNEERTPENLVKRVNEQYEELMKKLKEQDPMEYDYAYNPLAKEAEQRNRWETTKRRWEAEEDDRKRREGTQKKEEGRRNQIARKAEEDVPF